MKFNTYRNSMSGDVLLYTIRFLTELSYIYQEFSRVGFMYILETGLGKIAKKTL